MRGDLAPGPGLGSSVLDSFVLPPGRFVPKEVLSAWESSDPHAPRKSFSSSSAQKLGLAYQRKVVRSVGRECASRPEINFRPGVWYCYHDAERRRWCQPDILLENSSSKTLVVVEVKLRWTADAWWQVQRLYVPVLRRVFGPDWTLIPLVVTKSYDCAVGAPEEVTLIEDLFDAKPSKFSVLVVR